MSGRGLVVGVCGLNGSGKSVLCAALAAAAGCRVVSLSDAIRSSLAGDGIDPSRAALIARGNELRNEGGAGVLGARVGASIAASVAAGDAPRWVVDSFRHPDEVRELAAAVGDGPTGVPFVLVAVDAEPSVRYHRMRARGRLGDSITSFEEFAQTEALELAHPDPNGQQLAAVLELAAVRIDNNAECQGCGRRAGQRAAGD
ncbi:UPF0200 protein [Thecamonas trahens ATCC 50062]|uniref:UPF0200 protein n=1 Tax=Thecamonas trahens ATCC 50062 TaxID=461836 RepID=A0A0L0DNF6_THETB|nr:UPF0200 protein [Thecamonas trahens ATCC 50062]KNC52948.1 UPF0200 protein [Thecamonas trahens ATCC 50062]|eukprot:XP_013754842.1 UPF0200 protein [Thecamonas trahens ATCC 50062]